jgi:molybdopterin converting factor small subunit
MKEMKIKVRLFATLRDGRGKEVMVDGTDEMTCRDIIDQLAISEEDVSILLVNGRDAKLNDLLTPEDVVSIFPPVGGG